LLEVLAESELLQHLLFLGLTAIPSDLEELVVAAASIARRLTAEPAEMVVHLVAVEAAAVRRTQPTHQALAVPAARATVS
jgi:hypothetical protein